MRVQSFCIFVLFPTLLLAQLQLSQRESLSQSLLGFSASFTDLKATQDGRIFLSSSSEGTVFPISFDGSKWSKGNPLTSTPPITPDTKISISYPDSNDLLSVCTPFTSCTIYSLDGSIKYKKVGEGSFDSLQYGVFEKSTSGEPLFLIAGETGYIDAFKKGHLSTREYADFLEPTDDGLYYPEKSLLVGISNEGEVLLTKNAAQCTASCFSDGSVVKKLPIDFVNRAEIVRLSLTQETYIATCGLKGIHLFEIDSVSGASALVSQLSSSGCFALTSIPWDDAIVVIDDTANVIVYEVVENLQFDFMELQSRSEKRASGGTATTGTTGSTGTTGTTGTSATSATTGTTGVITTTTTTTGGSSSTTGTTSPTEGPLPLSPPLCSPAVIVTAVEVTTQISLGWINNAGEVLIIQIFEVVSGPCSVGTISPQIGESLEIFESFLGFLVIEETVGVYVCTARLVASGAKRTTVTVSYPVTIIVTGSNLKIATRSTLTLTEETELGVVSFVPTP